MRGIVTDVGEGFPEVAVRQHDADEAYITALYRDLLKREPETGVVERWADYLTASSRARLARKIASAEEHWLVLEGRRADHGSASEAP